MAASKGVRQVRSGAYSREIRACEALICLLSGWLYNPFARGIFEDAKFVRSAADVHAEKGIVRLDRAMGTV